MCDLVWLRSGAFFSRIRSRYFFRLLLAISLSYFWQFRSISLTYAAQRKTMLRFLIKLSLGKRNNLEVFFKFFWALQSSITLRDCGQRGGSSKSFFGE